MCDPSGLFSLFLGLCLLGVILAILLPERKVSASLAAVGALASLVVFVIGADVLVCGRDRAIELWKVSFSGSVLLKMDYISAFFVIVTSMVVLPVSIFSAGYMERFKGRYSMRSFGIFYHLLHASVVVLLVTCNVISFIFTWEIMSVLCYLLVNYEHEKERNTEAGFLMLAMSEMGTMASLAAFLLLALPTGSLDFSALRAGAAGLGESIKWAIFLLSFFGFGVKVGLVPTSIWLSRAHPAAPANISALLSGVILNLGLYGIIRINGDILPLSTAGMGMIVLVTGTVSAIVGILYATTENDMKTMLAHSSIENMGIVTAGLGAGFVFASSGAPALAGIAFIAAFYHMMGHSVYKALLFLGAGAVDSGAGSRDMDRLGGLNRLMPWTGVFFLIGSLSIAALPPFTGFVSEWLTLQTMLQSAALHSTLQKIVFALCGAVLALTAALAVTCFVKAFGMSFLGITRSEEADKAVEVRRSMLIPMGMLALFSLLLGVLPTYVIPVINRPVTKLTGQSAIDALVPPFFTVKKGDSEFNDSFVEEFRELGAQTGRDVLPGRGLVVLHRGGEKNPVVFAMSTSYTAVVLLLLFVVAFMAIRRLTRLRKVIRQEQWNGGLRSLTPVMTYTATGFSNPVRVIFEAIFKPSTFDEQKETVAEHFRTAIKSDRREVHIIERVVFQPLVRGLRSTAAAFGRLHTGNVNVYAAYVLFCLVAVLVIQWLW